MKSETRTLLDKAARAVRAAETMLREGDADFAAGRAYYAMFYAAEALLCEKGLRFRKHGGVHAAFAEQITNAGVLDKKFHRWLLDAFDQRIQGDYGTATVPAAEDVNEAIGRAREFLAAAGGQLEKAP